MIDIQTTNEQAIKDFLLDIECLDQLDEWTGKFNLFDILKITRTEIRHSNMLAWLLNPRENHGLTDQIIRRVIKHIINSYSEFSNSFDILQMDCSDFIILREWEDIDILAISNKIKLVICIENKIDSGEHDNQLNKYRNIVEEHYSSFHKIFLYLTPNGDEPSDLENWCSMSYQDVLVIIENACEKNVLTNDAEYLIKSYLDIIRRNIVGDNRLAELCAQIYAKHQKALDLIFENRPDQAAQLANIFKKWAIEMTKNGEIAVDIDKCNKSYTRFKTNLMSQILPDASEAKSGWNTKNHYFYEICNRDGRELYIQLALSAKNIPDDLLGKCNLINNHYPSKQQKPVWQWRLPFTTTKKIIDEDSTEDQIFERLNELLYEVKEFEQILMQKLSDI